MPTRRQLLSAGLCATAAAWAGPLSAQSTPSAPSAPLTRALPRSGEHLPVIGLGGWRNFDFEPGSEGYASAQQTLDLFAAHGGRLIDSSPMYGRSTTSMGEIARAGGYADRLFYASKVWTRGARSGQLQFEAERRRLGRPTVDLMQVHNLSDAATQLQVLREAKGRGELRLIGVSHYQTSAHLELEATVRDAGLDCVQLNYSILEPQAEQRLLPAAMDAGVGVLVNRPFAEGALFERARGRPLPSFAAELGALSWAQLFLKWVLAHPAVTVVITGTGNPRHIVDNLGAAAGSLPDADQRRRLGELLRG